MEEKRMFQLNGDISLTELVQLLKQYLECSKQMTTQQFDLESRTILQCRDKNFSWSQYIGLDAALTIELTETGNHTLTVSIGNAKWLDKVGVAAVGALFFSPLVVAAGIGALRQGVLPAEIFSFIENRLAGKKYTGKTASPAEEESITCPCCGSIVQKTHAFCSKCGSKL